MCKEITKGNTRKILAVALIFILAPGFLAVAAEEVQSGSLVSSWGLQFDQNAITTMEVTATTPMNHGDAKWFLGVGRKKLNDNLFGISQKDSYFSLGGTFYPSSNSVQLGDVILRLGFGMETFLKTTRAEVLVLDHRDFVGGVHVMGVGDAHLNLGMINRLEEFELKTLNSWDLIFGFEGGVGVLFPLFPDAKLGGSLGFEYIF